MLPQKMKDGTFPMPATAQEVIRAFLSSAKKGKIIIRIPSRESGDRISKGMHYHLEPEMFLQISGWTEFTFPGDSFNLMPGEICVIPGKVGHSERTFNLGKLKFYNMVVMPRATGIGMHIAESTPKNEPRGTKGFFMESAINSKRMIKYFNDIAEFSSEIKTKDSKELINSILQSSLLMLLHIIKTENRIEGNDRIANCRTIVANSISDTSLNVRKVASMLSCSPDYLSNIFHKRTGMKLTEYINQQRIELAKDILKSTSLSVKEIAWACGYADPGYFTRVFRLRSSMPPRGYRKK